MRVTIVYDNKALMEGLRSDWGFSCLVEAYGKKILFDTGASGSVLLGNMKKLMIKPSQITEIFISHAHGDHTGGLSDLLKVNPVKVYIPPSCLQPPGALEVIKVTRSFKIHENIFSTGVLMNIEQSLLVQTEKGLVVIVGCSHPGVRSVFRAASQFGKARALIGGCMDSAIWPDPRFGNRLSCPLYAVYDRNKITVSPQVCPGGSRKSD